jgi:hypothetical protein
LGHHGVAGRLIIILSSPQGRYFAIACGACDIFQTKFHWNIHNIRINCSPEHHQISLQDDSGLFLRTTCYMDFHQLLNIDLAIRFEARKRENNKKILSDLLDVKNSFMCSDRVYIQNKLSQPSIISMGDFNGTQNTLHFTAKNSNSIFIIKEPTYLSRKTTTRCETQLEIKSGNSKSIKVIDTTNQDFIIEGGDIAIVDDSTFYAYMSKQSIENELLFPQPLGFGNLKMQQIVSIKI